MDYSDFFTSLRAHGRSEDIPNVSDETARFLADMIRISGAREVLEIGTANGYSTIHLTLALRETGGRIVSIDRSRPTYDEAVENVRVAQVDDICTLVFGNALDEIPKLSDRVFDFVFIDAQKSRTLEFFRLAYPLVRPGGFIIVDDVIKFRFKMESFYEYLSEAQIPYSILQTDPDDGVMLIVKPKEL